LSRAHGPAEESKAVEKAAQGTAGIERFTAVLLSTPFLGVLLAALTWPIESQVPTVGPDASWVAGLYMALQNGLHFGTQFVFTYGPLGFLEHPALYDGGLWCVAFLYRALIYAALATSLVWAARRALPVPLAAAAVYLLLVVGYLEAAAVLLTLVLCVGALGDRPPARAPWLIAVGGGALAAVELLGKLNFGLTIMALCLIALLGLERRRLHMPLFGATFLVVLAAAWFGTGQTLAAVPHFAANSLQVLTGYSQAMGTDIADVGWERPWAIASIVLLVAAAAAATWRDPTPRRLAVVSLVAVFGFAMFKQSFVRQGLGNASDFFPLMLGAAVAVAWRLPRRLGRLPEGTPSAALLVSLAVLTLATLHTPSLWRTLEPGDHVEYLREGLRALASPSERDALEREGAEGMVSTYRLDPPTLALLRGRTVDVEPWEIGAAWAYRLDWQPLPVIQGYQAYTSRLDGLNAAALADPGRPAAILRQNTSAFAGTIDASIDDRYEAWDPPAAARAMLCHYRPARTTTAWQVLYPTPNRCGTAHLLTRVETETGAGVRIPPAADGQIVFARIRGLGVEGLEALRTTLYRARDRWATVDGGRFWRVVPGTAEDGLILRAGKDADFPAPFALAPQARSVSFEISGARKQIEVAFYAQTVAAAGARDRSLSGSFRRG
jgi:hypothetical protein